MNLSKQCKDTNDPWSETIQDFEKIGKLKKVKHIPHFKRDHHPQFEKQKSWTEEAPLPSISSDLNTWDGEALNRNRAAYQMDPSLHPELTKD